MRDWSGPPKVQVDKSKPRQIINNIKFNEGNSKSVIPVSKVWFHPLFLRPFLTRKFFQEILVLEGSKKFLEKNRQVHNLNISDRLLRSKSFLQENIPGFICRVFCSA